MSMQHKMECSTLKHLRRVIADAAATIAKAQAQIDLIEDGDRDAAWRHLIAEVRRKRPLIRMWLEFGALVKIADEYAVVGFPPHQALALEQLDSPSNRELLSEILSAYLGRSIRVELWEVAE